MSFDFYRYLSRELRHDEEIEDIDIYPHDLACGFLARCAVEAASVKGVQEQREDKNRARSRYLYAVQSARNMLLPEVIASYQSVEGMQPGWLLIEVSFTLQTPWYSKDDRPFHVLDNPVRKDRVFGVPFMSAAGWKGLLRWVLATRSGLIGPTTALDEKKKEKAQAVIMHLFGNEKGETDEFHRGALVFFPTWFDRIGIEVINPHRRQTRAGSQPIYYEVVPPLTKGQLRLLYAPMPYQAWRDRVKVKETMENLVDAVNALLTQYGFSAKRTSGWGLASVDWWAVQGADSMKYTYSKLDELKNRLSNLLQTEEDQS